ncbi:Hsp20/alpha crystallin family protein [Nodosilinea sp. AN01ver1]|uniref:Hsp20/alpha crystallin family protein n=1 Tax=Nodosilinea sp. AN01ver1 TaxID=3423362 RepID=UPI003D3227BD
MPIMRYDPLGDIARWEPFRGIERLHREMNHLFDRFLAEGDGDGDRDLKSLTFMPSAEMEETDDAIHLKLEIPGMEAKDLDLQVTESSVLVRGDRKSESKHEEKGLVRSEFHYGQFERMIPLPVRIQTDHVQADYKNGMVHLTLPKLESEQQKVVKVDIH